MITSKAWAVIPARLQSTRLHEKALHPIQGKALVQWVVEGVLKSKKIHHFVLATDSQKIIDLVQNAVKNPRLHFALTDPALPSGTDRVRAAVQLQLKEGHPAPHYIFNVQGDEPMIDGEILDELFDAWQKKPHIRMLTLARALTSEKSFNDLNLVKVLTNQNSEAIYFSRFPVPYSRGSVASALASRRVFHHIGLYGYDLHFLNEFCDAKPSELELAESLEQLRALELGEKIYVLETKKIFLGVDTIEDVKKVEGVLSGEKNQGE